MGALPAGIKLGLSGRLLKTTSMPLRCRRSSSMDDKHLQGWASLLNVLDEQQWFASASSHGLWGANFIIAFSVLRSLPKVLAGARFGLLQSRFSFARSLWDTVSCRLTVLQAQGAYPPLLPTVHSESESIEVEHSACPSLELYRILHFQWTFACIWPLSERPRDPVEASLTIISYCFVICASMQHLQRVCIRISTWISGVGKR